VTPTLVTPLHALTLGRQLAELSSAWALWETIACYSRNNIILWYYWEPAKRSGMVCNFGSPRGQSRKEMWLTGEKYDWLATWSRLEKAKWLTDDLSQYDWRQRRYDDFSQHRRHLQRSPDLLAGFEGMWIGKEKKGEKKTKGAVNGGEEEEKKGEGRKREGEKKRKGKGKGKGRYTPLFGTKWRQCQPVKNEKN